MKGRLSVAALLLVSTALAVPAIRAAQTPPAPVQAAPPADPERDRITAESAAERAREMQLL